GTMLKFGNQDGGPGELQPLVSPDHAYRRPERHQGTPAKAVTPAALRGLEAPPPPRRGSRSLLDLRRRPPGAPLRRQRSRRPPYGSWHFCFPSMLDPMFPRSGLAAVAAQHEGGPQGGMAAPGFLSAPGQLACLLADAAPVQLDL